MTAGTQTPRGPAGRAAPFAPDGPDGPLDPAATLAPARAQLWRDVRDGDEAGALGTVRAAVEAGAGFESVLLDLIAPVQARVGVEWAANRISVAQEHAATAINERVITLTAGAHAPEPPSGERRNRRITVACVDGEWHALPARLLAEVLRLRGWRVDFLGAHTPTPHLVRHLHEQAPDVVALSSSIPTNLPLAHAALTACQAVGMPVLVGGAAFGPGGRYAEMLGADAWAGDARDAADLLEQAPVRPQVAIHQAVDDLPHLVDQEYSMVARTRGELVKEVLHELEQLFPPMARYTVQQRQHTAEDIAHIVDYLATALYLDDAELFTRFLDWTADILTARHVPAHSLLIALDVLARRLSDFPRATRVLDTARHAVGARQESPNTGENA
ncbi:cobalamin B12-binding domain-containing protein [Streptomyces formicae]|uniref:5-methyltetrahydrofolate--homocysteine methyltransferase n=1 Tax=Streptomyces formicae TaxID=1616117 RepID=A0A291QIY4_9ACTN|nr:cobalamin-dependent protein [Streptomyces formicae]ATL31444.1 5-methyltetrahydrofolate--homocysteine methyltransferase [Streptomyces formicae]